MSRSRIKKYYTFAFIIPFICWSFLYISPIKKTTRLLYNSSQLKKIVSEDGDTVRIDFVDYEGKITVAADLGYATIIQTIENNGTTERFYDENGEPIIRQLGYYGIYREYDNKGNNIRISYLDYDGKLTNITNGYATEEREYNSNMLPCVVRYYDADGKCSLSNLYGYGKVYKYDEYGDNTGITFINPYGEPMMTGLGYATVIRRFYNIEGPKRGKPESEFYYDDKGKPVSLLLGEYGIHMDYDENGKKTVLTYLNEKGEPTITNKGYTTIIRTFHVDNSIATEQYFDLEGNPFSLSDGQYGIQKENNQVIYLDENGNEIFSFRRLLYNHSRIVIVLSLVVVIISVFSKEKQNFFLLVICIAGILYMTLLFRDRVVTGKQGVFKNIIKIFKDNEVRADAVRNIWLFIPFGAVLHRLYPHKAILLVPVALSVLIEGIQLFAGIGTCELDDIISNGLGGWIGFCMSRLTTDIKLSISNRKQHSA